LAREWEGIDPSLGLDKLGQPFAKGNVCEREQINAARQVQRRPSGFWIMGKMLSDLRKRSSHLQRSRKESLGEWG